MSPLAALRCTSEVVPVSLDELRAEMKKAARQVAPMKSARTAASFLGCWLDSEGNTVLVRWGSAASQQLTATLTQLGRADVHLSMWQTVDNGVWHCGDALLGMRASSAEQLTWVFRDGSISTWTWTAFTMEALEAKGLVSPTGKQEPSIAFKELAFQGVQEPSAAFKELAFQSSSDGGAPQEWIPVCVAIA